MDIDEKELREYFRKNSEALDEYLKIYKKEHECCPKCGESSYISTLLAIPFDMNNPDKYYDRNRAQYIHAECNHIHIVHDRVPKK